MSGNARQTTLPEFAKGSKQRDQPLVISDSYQSFDLNTAAKLLEQMQDMFIRKLASWVDQLQFSNLDA